MLKPHLPKSAVGPSIVAACLSALGFVILSSTHIYLVEQFICREYYTVLESLGRDTKLFLDPKQPVDEALCKEPAIQSTVASIQGINIFLGLTPTLFLVGPWGRLAKILGKKTVILLNSISAFASVCYYMTICYFPQHFNIRWIWATPLFDIIGGGPIILNSLAYTYFAEEIEPEDLSGVLYKFTAIQLLNAFLAMSFSSYMLRINVWILVICGLGFICLTIPVALLLPSDSSSYHSIPDTDTPICDTPETESLLSDDPKRTSTTKHILSALISHFSHSKNLYQELFASSAISRLTLVTSFFLTLTFGVRIIFTQWASVHYSWVIADVHVLNSFEMIVSGITLLSLPIISKRYLLPRLVTASKVDIILASISLGTIFIGLLCMALSPNRVCYVISISIYTLGSGLPDALRSFSTSLITNKGEVEKLYLGMGLMSTLGGMGASSIWSWVFSFGMGKSWMMERAPFWGGLVALLGVGLMIQMLSRHIKGVSMI